MTIASEITRIQGNIADAYTAVSNKGGTLPATQNSDNLPTAINSISGSSGSVDVPIAVNDESSIFYPLLFSGTSHGTLFMSALNISSSVTVTSGTYTLWHYIVTSNTWTLLATITL